MSEPKKTNMPPIGYRPVHLQPRLLECGHLSEPGAKPHIKVCKSCWETEQMELVDALEEKFELFLKITGKPKQVAWARRVRAFKVSNIMERIAAGTATQKNYEVLDAFRTSTDYKVFTSQIYHKTGPVGVKRNTKGKAPKGDAMPETYDGAEQGYGDEPTE